MMQGEEKHSYRFKSFRLDVAERQLLHHNEAVPLTPKAFDVLVALVERNGHLVEKDELLRTVWADSIVEEANVARIIHTLRRILGEDESDNKYIETVAKRGYRFVAKVSEGEEHATDGRSATEIDKLQLLRKMRPKANLRFCRHAGGASAVAPPIESKHTRRMVLVGVGFVSAVLLVFLLSSNHPIRIPQRRRS